MNLPGSPGGCRDGFAVLRPALDARARAARRRADRAPADVTALAYPARFASLVKFEHTIFALPFAYVGAFLAVDGVPSAHDLVWITVAMVGARSLAMGLNRLIDAGLDARNPRTAGRELPSGLLSPAAGASSSAPPRSAVFLVAVFQLDPLVHWLWPIPVAGFVIYPYLKRWTWLCHFWLGAVDGLAPVGAWAAITGKHPVGGVGARRRGGALGGRLRLLLRAARPRDRPRAGAAVVGDALRRAGRVLGRAALPCRHGRAARRRRARPRRSAPSTGSASPSSPALLAYEHSLVRPGDLRRLDTAFFTMNGVISVAFFVFVLLDVL